MTVDAYAALGEDDRYRSELQEGNLVMSPSPAPDHMIIMGKLFVQVDEQLPSGLVVIPDIDIDLELAPRGKPGFVRRPDLVVTHQAAVDRVRSFLLRGAESIKHSSCADGATPKTTSSYDGTRDDESEEFNQPDFSP